MSPWRIYRLPGSRQWWHVDAGPNTDVVNVLAVQSQVPMRSVDIGGDAVPRAWFEVEGELLVSANGQVAQFVSRESMKVCAGTPSNLETGDGESQSGHGAKNNDGEVKDGLQ